jgi:predicted acyl esterase
MKLRRKRLVTPVLVFSLAIFLISSGKAFGLGDELFTVRIEKGVDAPMRDGVRLSADVFRPDAPGKFPVILIRTPYDKEGYSRYSSFPDYAAGKGYVVIVQDVRG